MELEERAADPLAGGLMRGYQCGQLWGAALAAGTQAYQILGPGPRAEAAAVTASKRIVESFRERNKEIDCLELTGIDLENAQQQALRTFIKMFVGGGVVRCFSMSAACAHASYREINATLSEKQLEAPSTPVSCSALLAQKMGLSELQAIMAAGLAGGIGLSGGACGALGTAIWIAGMRKAGQQEANLLLGDPAIAEVIDRFAGITDHEFECSKITGRKFANVADHAAYLQAGGCVKIIEGLAV
jgi:hypothetical protein